VSEVLQTPSLTPRARTARRWTRNTPWPPRRSACSVPRSRWG